MKARKEGHASRNAQCRRSHLYWLLNRALSVWLILIAAEFVHGRPRAIFLVPARRRSVGQMFGDSAVPPLSRL
jgi:hypothetical protein